MKHEKWKLWNPDFESFALVKALCVSASSFLQQSNVCTHKGHMTTGIASCVLRCVMRWVLRVARCVLGNTKRTCDARLAAGKAVTKLSRIGLCIIKSQTYMWRAPRVRKSRSEIVSHWIGYYKTTNVRNCPPLNIRTYVRVTRSSPMQKAATKLSSIYLCIIKHHTYVWRAPRHRKSCNETVPHSFVYSENTKRTCDSRLAGRKSRNEIVPHWFVCYQMTNVRNCPPLNIRTCMRTCDVRLVNGKAATKLSPIDLCFFHCAL